MKNDFHLPEFPLSSKYNPDWIKASVSGGANPLWLAEWLSQKMELRPGMRVLDLGCGRAMSSIFMSREFGVQVWAADLLFSVSENYKRICDAGVEQIVFPINADARNLPFASGFFDAIVSIDSYVYYGTDDLYFNSLARFLKPGGQIGIAGAGLMQDLNTEIPQHLQQWWTPDLWCLHSAPWWERHWQRTGIIDVQIADTLSDGWRYWLKWHEIIAPDNEIEMEALKADQGQYLGYVRVIGRKGENIVAEEPMLSIPTEYVKTSLIAS